MQELSGLLLLVVLVNAAVLIYMIRSNSIDRKDMLDRLMSKDLIEYKEVTAPAPDPSTPVSLSDADEWAREVEMMNRAR